MHLNASNVTALDGLVYHWSGKLVKYDHRLFYCVRFIRSPFASPTTDRGRLALIILSRSLGEIDQGWQSVQGDLVAIQQNAEERRPVFLGNRVVLVLDLYCIPP